MLSNNSKTFLILDLLRTHGGMYGLELVKESNNRLKRGTIYVTLTRLVDKGWVNSERQEGADGQKTIKRLYTITGEGQRAVMAANAYHETLKGVYDDNYSTAPS